MKMLIDSANIQIIEKLFKMFPYDGVTTNPSILKKENTNPMNLLKKISELMPKNSTLHAQVISTTCDEIVKEAYHLIKNLGEELYVKIPVFDEGLKAISILSKENINITATAIYTPMQGFLAAKAGALFVAPYVNRIDNLGADGITAAKTIHDILKINNFKTEVLAASFKNNQQVLSLCHHGIGAITASPEVLEQLSNHQSSTQAINDFNNDFYILANGKKTMLDF